MIDTFFACNLALGFTVWLSANRAVYFTLVAEERVTAFFFFAGLLLAVLGTLWICARHYLMPTWVLATVELALLMHFAGGWIHFGGLRLYGHLIGGIRFDKFVHVAATFAAASVLLEFSRLAGLGRSWLTQVLVALGALGVGAGVEAYEYLVTQTMPMLTTARFEDSLRDLIADLAGMMLWLAISGRVTRRFGRAGNGRALLRKRGVERIP